MEIIKLLKGRPFRIMKLLGLEYKKDAAAIPEFREMDVTTIMVKLRDSSQSSVSQDLARMKKAGIVRCEQRGLHVFYRLSDGLCDTLNSIGKPEVAIMRHNALEKGKNRKPIVAFLKANPASRTADICPSMDRATVSHELAILRKAGVLEVGMDGKKKVYSLKNQQ